LKLQIIKEVIILITFFSLIYSANQPVTPVVPVNSGLFAVHSVVTAPGLIQQISKKFAALTARNPNLPTTKSIDNSSNFGPAERGGAVGDLRMRIYGPGLYD
jgi:hypothetical protein